MSTDKVWSDFAALPEESQKLVADLIAFLRAQQAARSSRPAPRKGIAAEPFIGIWRDRDEMADSTAWVRETRKRQWSRRRNA